MSLWQLAPVSAEPEKTIDHWSIREDNEGELHFVGYCKQEGGGVVSSAIQKFDPQTMRGITRSGRVYSLVGESGRDFDAEYVWFRWCVINKVTSWTDVSERVISRGVGAEAESSNN